MQSFCIYRPLPTQRELTIDSVERGTVERGTVKKNTVIMGTVVMGRPVNDVNPKDGAS